MQAVDWQDFRDHLSTADPEGRRLWLYPRQPRGPFYRARTGLSWLLLAILIAGPFVRIHGHPLLLLNIVERRQARAEGGQARDLPRSVVPDRQHAAGRPAS